MELRVHLILQEEVKKLFHYERERSVQCFILTTQITEPCGHLILHLDRRTLTINLKLKCGINKISIYHLIYIKELLSTLF